MRDVVLIGVGGGSGRGVKRGSGRERGSPSAHLVLVLPPRPNSKGKAKSNAQSSPCCVMYRTHGSAWYPLFSTILRYRTWIPETVKYCPPPQR